MSDWRSRWTVEWAQIEANEPAIHSAARNGDDAAVRRLVERGADVDEVFDVQVDPGARSVFVSALGWAAGSADGASAATVALLLDLGARLEVDGARSPLLCALAGVDIRFSGGGDIDRVRVLADAYEVAGRVLPFDSDDDWLDRAVATGDPERVRFLLDRGADPNPPLLKAWTSTPLDEAVELDSEELVRVLLEAGADPNRRAFHLHFLLGTARSLAVLELLLDAGAVIEPPIIGQPDRRSHDAAGYTLSGIACASEVERSERVAMLNVLVERRSLTQHDLDNGLWHAAFDPADSEGVHALLEAGASLHGDLPLLASVCFGHQTEHDAGVEAVVDALIDAGLDPNDQDENGFRPLLTALGPDTFGPGYQESDGYNRPAALALVRRGAEVNIRYPDTEVQSIEDVVVVGFTPLHLAARVGDGDVVRALLDAGADPTAQTPGGQTARDLAQAELEAMTGPGSTPPPEAAEGASAWRVRSAQEERRRWDQSVIDARSAVDLLAGTTLPGS